MSTAIGGLTYAYEDTLPALNFVCAGLGSAETRRLLNELLSYPGVPPEWRTLDLDVSTAPFLAIEFSGEAVAGEVTRRRGDCGGSLFRVLRVSA